MGLRILTITAAAATLALVVASANAATLTSGHPWSPTHRTATQKHVDAAEPTTSANRATAPPATPEIFTAPFPTFSIVAPRYLYSPGAPPGSAVPYVGDCETTGNNCTAQQLCEVWGIGCP